MNRRFAQAFAAVCIAAALGSAASVAYRVLSADASGRKAAKADFEGLRSVLAYVKASSDLAEPSLRARLASRYEANPSLLLVDVYERGIGDRWRIPSSTPYLPQGPAEGAAPAPAYPPASTILLSSPLKGDSSGKLAVDALYTSLTQATAFEAFRDALIALGAFLALAALILAFVSGAESKPKPAASAAPQPSEEESAESTAARVAAAAAEDLYDALVAEEAERESAAKKGISIKLPAESAEEEFDIPIMSESEPVSEAAPSPAAAPAQAPVQAEQECPEQPEGLYSPASGLGWEPYMKDRLDAELSRSASFEQDLSLLVLSYDGLSSQDASYAEIGAAIQKFFSFRDLAFERGDDGFAVILPNIDSSHALRMAEEFMKKLVFLAEGDFAELDLLPIYMGISSRSGRLVDALRLAKEASAALERARYEKDTHIVAFSPDPDKYRLYLASKGA